MHGCKSVSLVFSYEETVAPWAARCWMCSVPCLLELSRGGGAFYPVPTKPLRLISGTTYSTLLHLSVYLWIPGLEQECKGSLAKSPILTTSGDPRQGPKGRELSATHLAGLHPPLHPVCTSWKSSLKTLLPLLSIRGLRSSWE